jgi:4-oxalocrotonate tautomerase
MPMITVEVSADPDELLAARIAETISGLTARVLGKDPRVTAVAVTFVPRGRWFVAGRSTAERGRPAFFVDVRVSDGTNTKDEKARFVAEAFHAMGRLLGPVEEESYVHVDDARADAYGYGGLTQERRYVEARPAPGNAG